MYKIVTTLKKKLTEKIVIGFLIIALASIILGSYNFFIISISLFFLYNFLSPLLNYDIFNSFIYRSLLVFFCYVILLECTILTSWLIYNNFPLVYVPGLLLSFLVAIKAIKYKLKIKSKPIDAHIKTKRILHFDILSLLVATLITSIIAIPPILCSPNANKIDTFAISMIDGNVDDSAHLALINDSLHFDRGVVAKSDTTSVARNADPYPAGWHGVSALLISAFYPSIKTGSASMFAYGILKLFWIFILVYFLTRISFYIFEFLNNKKINIFNSIFMASISLLLCFLFLLPMSRDGFYSYFPQLITAILAIPILIQVGKSGIKGITAPLFIICLGGCLSWFLPLPAFALAIAVNIFILIFSKNIKVVLAKVWQILKSNLLIGLFVSTAIISQLLILRGAKSSNGTSTSFLNQILTDGGVVQFDVFFYCFLSIGFLAALIYKKKETINKITPLLILMAIIASCCAFIYLLQIYYIGRNAYYYYKLLYILLIMAMPFCISGYAIIINKLSGKNNLTTIFTALFAVALMLQILKINGTLYYAGGARALTEDTSSAIIKELNTNISQDNYFKKQYSFIYSPDTGYYFQNAVSIIIAKSNMQNSNCLYNTWVRILQTSNAETMMDGFIKDCKGYKINLVTKSGYDNDFNNVIKQKNTDDIVKIITY